MSSHGRVFLTGATGFVGMEVLVRYLERGSRPVTCLVRADSDEAAREELAERYAEMHLRPQVAAATGHIDELIAPEMTRQRVAWALRSLHRASR